MICLCSSYALGLVCRMVGVGLVGLLLGIAVCIGTLIWVALGTINTCTHILYVYFVHILYIACTNKKESKKYKTIT